MTVHLAARYEAYWQESFPNEIEWYELTAVYQKDIDYQAVLFQHRQVLEQDGRKERAAFTHDISEFMEWFIDSVQCCIDMLEAGSYAIDSLPRRKGVADEKEKELHCPHYFYRRYWETLESH